jgi:hypothetical protein
MTAVTRYRPYYFDQTKVKGFDATMRENSAGGYVRWEDYERLRAAAGAACSEMGCYCPDEGALTPDVKCVMCKLEAALHG